MEKKSGRSVQPLSKGIAFEKKNQDSNNGKLYAKGTHRRESASGNLPVKAEPTRKLQPQRIKSSDKRPRARGRPDALARNEASCVEENQCELGSVSQPGSKKQSLNHLLNFTYAPRSGETHHFGSRGSHFRNGNHSLFVKKHKYIKEHFLQANCQFIVNTSGDYKQYLNDPDALVEWNFIEQINVQVNDSPSCPICLHPPAAAKITRCGHIYCWCCILHFLSLCDKPDHKCPICYENVCKEDLKSVVIIPHNTFNIGETITFKLMKRSENSLTPYPADDKVVKENHLMSFSEEQPNKIYSKLLLAQNQDILSIIDREMGELQYQLETEEESEQIFIEEAIIYLKERETRVISDHFHDLELTKYTLPEENVDIFVEPTSEKCLEKQMDSKCIYFYQACDGQHIYIHSINVRMLKHTYGSLEHAPNTLTARILAKEVDSMSEDYRKRYKYLAHLPVTCCFDTVEIELGVPIVSQETLDIFKDELDRRKKQRAKKAKEEKQRERRITIEENKKIYNKSPMMHISLESPQQFPTFGSKLEEVEEIATNIDLNQPNCSSQEYSGPSFAKMAAATKVSSWPGLKTSSAAFNISTTKKLTPLSTISGSRHKVNEDHTDDLESSEYEFSESRATFGDAIAQAFEKVAQNDMSPESFCPGDKRKKKKKKNKHNILVATSSGYSGN
ncbi:hypothetical protein HHI36_009053 [Cryptolaemus montrouzieri]|uniref:E3 ubiquitin-protein ligase RNF10 n=1 Tax=Cryptolaemus montrouzieri TaxID=559131 RepID=A0ABD2MV31_9CUCU